MHLCISAVQLRDRPFCAGLQEDTVNAPGSRQSMPDLIEELLGCRSPEAFGPLQFCFLHPMHGSALQLGRTTKVCPIILCSGHFWVAPLRAMGGLREEILLVLDHIISAALSDSRMSRVMLSRLSHYSFSRSLNFKGCQSDRISSNTWKWLNFAENREQAFLFTDSHTSSSCSLWGQTEWKWNIRFIIGHCQNIFHTNVSRPEPGLQLQIHLLQSSIWTKPGLMLRLDEYSSVPQKKVLI